jgi:sugar-specific transcriptional regulator TrmB
MGERKEACERLLDNLEDALASLERGKEECEMENWELFAPEDLDEVIEKLREMASKLNLKISGDDFGEEE